MGRGAVFGDYDNDGDTDIFIVNLNQEGVLLRNEGGNRHNWLTIKTVGVKSNRDGIGARVEVVTRSHTLMKEVQAGSSYLSGHDLRLLFGLGTERRRKPVKITWPSGVEQTLENVEANQLLIITRTTSRVSCVTFSKAPTPQVHLPILQGLLLETCAAEYRSHDVLG